jgi:lipopolysaccharide biosynthesis regulator YciM
MELSYEIIAGAGLLLFLLGLAMGLMFGRGKNSGAPQDGLSLPAQIALPEGAPASAGVREFIDGLHITPLSAEYYHELGDLLRQKGELESAVLLRQRMINDPQLPAEEKKKAWFALGLDYRHSGMLNLAIDTFKALLQADSRHADAGRNLVYLYEEIHEWDQAFAARKRVDKILNKTSPAILAHYKTELGKQLAAGNPDLAERNFGQAIKIHSQCLDAYLHLGDLYLQQGKAGKAFEIWAMAARINPAYAHLIISRLCRLPQKDDAMEGAIARIFPAVKELHPLSLLELSKWYLGCDKDYRALTLLDLALEKAPDFIAAHDLRGRILVEQHHNTPIYKDYKTLLSQIKDRTSTSYRCRHCGFTSYELSWQCPRCRHWDSIEVLSI